MKCARRLAVTAAALGTAAALLAGCAPATSAGAGGQDGKSGTLRVWLFREVGNGPKERVVEGVVEDFEKAHRGVRVDVRYIPVDSRAEKIKGAFNDPESAPDVIEYGNTDTAGYVRSGGLADVGAEFGKWDEAGEVDPTALKSATVDGKIYGAPFFVGVRALYYRTDLFERLGLEPPRTLGEVERAAHRIRSAEPELYGLAVGGSYTYAALPCLWAHGGELARSGKDGFSAAVDSAPAKAGIKAYTGLFGEDNCPASSCAGMGGNDAVDAFAGGKAGMVIGGDFNRRAMDAGEVEGHYAVVPLPGRKKGETAPAFAGGNNLGVLRSSSHRTVAVEFMQQLAGKKAQRELFEAMGFLPTFTDVRAGAAKSDPFVAPFVKTLDSGSRFVPVTPGWAEIDAGRVLPTMYQEIVSGRKGVDEAAGDASAAMDEAFRR